MRVEMCHHKNDGIRCLEFSERDLPLRRKTMRWTKSRFASLGPKWGSLLTAYCRHLPAYFCGSFERVMNGFPCDCCESCLLQRFKELSRVCLEDMIRRGVDDRVYFLDLGCLGGYDTVENRKDPMETVRTEFGSGSPVLPDSFYRKIDETIDLITVKQPPCSFSEFVSFRDAWANPGASTMGKPAKIEVSRIRRGRRDVRDIKVTNKWFKALSMTDAEVETQCLSGKPARVRPFRKMDEPAKARTVQCFDTNSLIRSSYMLEAIKSLNGRRKWTTVGMTAQEKMQFRRKLFMKMDDPDSYLVCTDQSGFDIHQSRDAVIYAVRRLGARIRNSSESMAQVVDAELRALESAFLEVGEDRFDWSSGLLSGMKFTALVGSILNRASSLWVMEDISVPVMDGYFQGDDAVMECASAPDLSALRESYAKLGQEVNPLKTWVSKSRCEFLHEIYDAKRVYGFPARVFKSLLWHKPSVGIRIGGAGAVEEELSTLRIAARRGLFGLFPIASRLFSIVAKSVDRSKLGDAWNTPTCFGGLGFGDGGRTSCSIESAQRRDFRVAVVSERGYAQDVGDELLQAAARNRAAGAVGLPGFVTEVKFRRFRGIGTLGSYSSDRAKAFPRLELTWDLPAFRWTTDVYRKKLVLEHKLQSLEKIVSADIPTDVFNGLDVDRCVRRYTSLVRRTMTIAGSAYHFEPYSGVARWADRVWAGVCGLLVLGEFKASRLDETWNRIAISVWQMVRYFKSDLEFRV
uniref:RNA-directed RNA polymerase n=1 Tax=Phytophthora dsRNA virus 1 TaxID=3071755 RepID=A0AA51BT78_9VIRU|nr:RNA-dependent RNA polymerase [Phytophthora dsRNA virus 1]